MSSVTMPGTRRDISAGPTTSVGIPIRCCAATFARRAAATRPGTSCRNPVRTKPGSPSPTRAGPVREVRQGGPREPRLELEVVVHPDEPRRAPGGPGGHRGTLQHEHARPAPGEMEGEAGTLHSGADDDDVGRRGRGCRHRQPARNSATRSWTSFDTSSARKRPIGLEVDRPLPDPEARQLAGERVDRRSARVEGAVALRGAEADEVTPVQPERRHAVADPLRDARRRLVDLLAEALERDPLMIRHGGQVLVDGGCRHRGQSRPGQEITSRGPKE